ncbi:signal peptidase I [Patescibacteria group bacterium]|nr:signal peptidase I [Patescibacteria group bacterium]
MQEESRENFFIELLKFALIAVVIVVPVRLYVAQPFIVSGASMEPTFDNGQYLIVDELSYRLEDPSRGDVIIFRPPGQSNGTYFIKRVIGLPGETVRITDSAVSITSIDGIRTELDEWYIKNIGNGKTMQVALGKDEYFVMGDNRPESSDSRYWGVLPRGNIIGRALFRLLPLQSISILPGSTSFK